MTLHFDREGLRHSSPKKKLDQKSGCRTHVVNAVCCPGEAPVFMLVVCWSITEVFDYETFAFSIVKHGVAATLQRILRVTLCLQRYVSQLPVMIFLSFRPRCHSVQLETCISLLPIATSSRMRLSRPPSLHNLTYSRHLGVQLSVK